MNAKQKVLKIRRSAAVSLLLLVVLGLSVYGLVFQDNNLSQNSTSDVLSENVGETELAIDVLNRLEIKGRAPKTGYSRDEFGSGWASVEGCDLRNIILQRSLTEVELDSDDCTVLSGLLADPYTGSDIAFTRGWGTSDDIQIDHVVALSDAWQKGAQELDFSVRVEFANDPLNLLAVDGPANQQKGDSDAASWLPENKVFRCAYVARQVSVKDKYSLWVSEAEFATIRRVLNGCGDQRVPFVE